MSAADNYNEARDAAMPQHALLALAGAASGITESTLGEITGWLGVVADCLDVGAGGWERESYDVPGMREIERQVRHLAWLMTTARRV